MKKVFLAAMAVCAAFASCSNDDNVDGTNLGEGKKAVLNISVSAPQNSRASGTAAPGTDNAVNNFSVFIANGNGEIKWKDYSGSSSSLTLDVTTGATKVYVIANAGNLATGAGAISTKAALEAYLADLSTQNPPTAGASRWATGDLPISSSNFVLNNNNYEANVTVDLTFIAARITVTVDNSMEHYGDAGALTLQDIAVMNARGQSLLFGNSLIPASYDPNKKFYEGIANDNFAYYPTTNEFTFLPQGGFLRDALPDPAVNTSLQNIVYYYYVFENDAVTKPAFPTVVTLKGVDKDGKSLYWPVHLAPYEQWASGSGAISNKGVERGKSYNIHIKLKGDALTGGGGVEDPTDPVYDATIEVSVNIKDWVPVTLNKEFN